MDGGAKRVISKDSLGVFLFFFLGDVVRFGGTFSVHFIWPYNAPKLTSVKGGNFVRSMTY